MTRIALNGRFTGTTQPTGTQTAAYGLFDQILRENQTFEFVVFADSRFGGVAQWRNLPGVIWVEVPFQDGSRAAAQIWEQVQFPRLSRRYGCALAHHPMNTSPVWKNGCRTIVTLHDLNFLRHPEWFSWKFRLAYALLATPGIRRADRVVTISDYVQTQAADLLRLPPERLRRVYNGIKPVAFLPPAADTTPYVLCVGALPVHKNLVRTLQAYLQIRDEFPGLELRVVGRALAQHARDSQLPALLEQPGVKRLGYLSDEELAAAYAGAKVFCYPSLEEGFGLPILESMLAGTPVVTSNVSCLPEIAGPAATLVDPYSVEAIAMGLRQMLTLSPQARSQMIDEARRWACKFSWTQAARDYLKIYGELA